MDGPTAHKRLDQLNSVPALILSNPARPFNWTVGKNTAFATPMLALAAAIRRSAAEISGRRSSNSEGNPDGLKGGAVESACSETRNVEAGSSTKDTHASSNWVRSSPTSRKSARPG